MRSSECKLSRRQLLSWGAKTGLLGTVTALGLLPNMAQAAVNDYKALVCVYLFGGNDGNNMVVPLDADHYNKYRAIRGNLALSQTGSTPTLLGTRNAQLQLVAENTQQEFAFHYGMPELDGLYASGKLAVVLNVGSLRQPTSKDDFRAGRNLPPELFSHSDQQLQMQAGSPAVAGTGWGGRLLDVLGSGGDLDAVALGNGGLFIEGANHHGNLLPTNGQLDLHGMRFWPQKDADARRNALLKILAAQQGNRLALAANRALANGIDLVADLQQAQSGGALSTVFPNENLANQMKTVANLIRMRAAKGPGRQVYFVALGGFDTHGGQAWQQFDCLRRVSQAMAAFHAATQELQLENQVTSFTLSDFGRTLQPNSGGTDHAWGNHQLVLGGAVRGGLYGRFPEFTLGGADDATGRGVWIPQFSNQQFGASLGAWFGADSTQLEQSVFKDELTPFALRNLGFMA